MIRRGLNKRNYEYWRDEVFIKIHDNSEENAHLKAKIVCLEQESEMLKSRIIKIEKKQKRRT